MWLYQWCLLSPFALLVSLFSLLMQWVPCKTDLRCSSDYSALLKIRPPQKFQAGQPENKEHRISDHLCKVWFKWLAQYRMGNLAEAGTESRSAGQHLIALAMRHETLLPLPTVSGLIHYIHLFHRCSRDSTDSGLLLYTSLTQTRSILCKEWSRYKGAL